MYNLNLRLLEDIPECCVYTFIDHKSKAFYALHSSMPLIEISKNVYDLKHNLHKCIELQELYNAGNVELCVLYVTDNNTESQPIIRAAYTAECNKLETAGYKNLRPDYKAAEFKLKTQILYPHHAHAPRFFVIAESRRKERLVLGIFETIQEGKDWCTKRFPNPKSIIPVFHNNKLTVDYYNEFGYKLNM